MGEVISLVITCHDEKCDGKSESRGPRPELWLSRQQQEHLKGERADAQGQWWRRRRGAAGDGQAADAGHAAGAQQVANFVGVAAISL